MIHRELLIDGVFIGGTCDEEVPKAPVFAPYDGHVVGTVAEATRAHAQAALGAAERAFATWRHSPRRERQSLLRRIAGQVRERHEELAEILTNEVGKPITLSRGEVTRLALTFELAADLLSHSAGEIIPVDYDGRGDGHRCVVERFPIGPVLAIVPYNWPYNLAAHKIAPAIAAGNTIVVKASRAAALSTLSLAQIVQQAGCPTGVVNVVNCDPRTAEELALDGRVKMVSFTGSPEIGWKLKRILAEKRVSLELGGNAFAVVCRDADLDWAAKRVALGAYGYAGQICIAVQHVLCDAEVYAEFTSRLIQETQSIAYGDPTDAKVVCGPMIDSGSADRVMDWVTEAELSGAKLLAGGNRIGSVIEPTLIEGMPDGAKLSSQEVFGPVLTLDRFETTSEAWERVNASSFGIHAGVFTHDIRVAEQAFRELEVGGVIVNDYPTLRFDSMPYGGVKRSGFGREGVRYTYDEMTELKAMLVRTI